MKYKIIFKVIDDISLVNTLDIETKGKGKKVLKAIIKKELFKFIKENDNCFGKVKNIEILDIIKTEHIRCNQVFSKENEYKNFINKLLKD